MAAVTSMATTRLSPKTMRWRSRCSASIMGMSVRTIMITATKVTATRTITAIRTITKATYTTNLAATRITLTMRIAELTALLHLASPALPIGAFSYSQGLEAAIEAQLITDADSARDWIASGL